MASVYVVSPIENFFSDVLKKGARFSIRFGHILVVHLNKYVYLLLLENESHRMYELGARLSGVPDFMGFPIRGD